MIRILSVENLFPNWEKGGLCMSNKNGKLRKKFVRLGVSVVVIAILFAALALVPAFHSAEYEIRDNHLTVERTNKHNTNMDVELYVIDEKGNVRETTVKINFEENVKSYSFDDEYFKNILKTEDDVFIKEVKSDLITCVSSYTPGVAIVLGILLIILFVACFFLMFSIFSFTC